MAEQERGKSNVKRVQRLKTILIGGFAVIVVIAISAVTVLAISKTDAVLKNKVSTLVSSLNVQMKLNMNSYLSRMETLGTLAFAAEEAYTYDATAENTDEYEALSTEKIISDKLYSLCIMENFVDYGIVYRNNHSVGKISNGTVSLFGDRLFEDLHAMINQTRTRDGWSAGYGDNFKRIYYVKEVHENAVLVISFYATELESVFDNPETLSDMTIRLTNAEYEVIYSSDESDALGQQIPSEMISRINMQDGATIMDDDYLITVSGCGNDWYVICSIPTQIILNEKNEVQLYIMLTAIVAALLAVLLGMTLSIKLTDVITDLVSNLDTKARIDQLTGILNKRSFEEATETCLNAADSSEKHALILLDVDNFKGVNDTLGHAYGDAVLAKIGSTLLTVFSKDDYPGRIGGDEFCVCMNVDGKDRQQFEELVKSKCEALADAFHNYYTGDDGDYKISCSMGVALFPSHGTSFKELYASADKALYASKHKGKDTYTVYDPSLNTEAEEDAK